MADNHAAEQAAAKFASIKELVEALRVAREEADIGAIEATTEAICAEALEVLVRPGWVTPGSGQTLPLPLEEFAILLCTGGPAVRIIGRIGEYGQPERSRLQWQDWGTPWTDWADAPPEAEDILDDYAGCFWLGDN